MLVWIGERGAWPGILQRRGSGTIWHRPSPRRGRKLWQGGAYPLNDDVFTDAEFLADGEELAEGGVDELLQAMAPALRGCGVVLEVQAGEVPEVTEDYIVQINGRRCRVWGPEDWRDYRCWYYATVRPLAVVNDLLAETGTNVRAFTLSAGGNEGLAQLLDPRVPAAMARSGLFGEDDMPELATHDSQP